MRCILNISFSRILIFVAALTLFNSCEECSDCKDLVRKSILVVNANGDNLVFGMSAIYDADSVTISANDNAQPIVINEEEGTVAFFLEDTFTSYTLQLDPNTSDSLAFDLSERDSERCCGTQTFSTATRVNGEETTNNDTIIIIK